MKREGIIEDSQSPWSSSVVLAKKPDSTWGFCVDYLKLNSITVDDVYPIPNIKDFLKRLKEASLITLMNLQSDYHQFALDFDGCNYVPLASIGQWKWPIHSTSS